MLERFLFVLLFVVMGGFYACQTVDGVVDKYLRYAYHELNMTQEQRDKNQLLAGAMDYYVVKDYAQAIAKLQEQIKLQKGEAVSYFYMGLSYMYLGEYEEAIQSMEQGIAIDPELYDYTSHWYMGLCYIKMGQTDKARPHLQYILDHDPDKALYKENARLLLDKL